MKRIRNRYIDRLRLPYAVIQSLLSKSLSICDVYTKSVRNANVTACQHEETILPECKYTDKVCLTYTNDIRNVYVTGFTGQKLSSGTSSQHRLMQTSTVLGNIGQYIKIHGLLTKNSNNVSLGRLTSQDLGMSSQLSSEFGYHFHHIFTT